LETKNYFGTPRRNEANGLAVRRHVRDIMVKHGVRPSHINQILPSAIAMVFCENDSELCANALWESSAARVRSNRPTMLSRFKRSIGWCDEARC